MAINTGGFTVSEMPRLGQVDPRITATDPYAFSTGLQKAFSVASDEEKYKSLVALNDEVAQLRNDRMAAASMGYKAGVAKSQKEIALAPVQTTADLGDLTKRIALSPGDTANALTRQQLETGTLGFNKQMQPTQQATAKIGMESALEVAPNNATNALNDSANAVRSSDRKFDNQDSADEIAQLESSNKLNDLRDYATQHPLDEQAKRDYQAAQIANLTAQSHMHDAYAAARLAGRPIKATDPIARDKILQASIASHRQEYRDKMNDKIGVMSDGKTPMQLSTYFSQSRAGDGSINDGYKPGQPNWNWHAEQLLHDAKSDTDAIKYLNSALSTNPSTPYVPQAIIAPALPGYPTVAPNAIKPVVGPQAPVTSSITLPTAPQAAAPQVPDAQPAEDAQYDIPATDAPPSDLTPADARFYEWARSHPDDPASKAVMDKINGG